MIVITKIAAGVLVAAATATGAQSCDLPQHGAAPDAHIADERGTVAYSGTPIFGRDCVAGKCDTSLTLMCQRGSEMVALKAPQAFREHQFTSGEPCPAWPVDPSQPDLNAVHKSLTYLGKTCNPGWVCGTCPPGTVHAGTEWGYDPVLVRQYGLGTVDCNARP